MDLRDGPEEAAFRATLRTWLEANVPAGLRGFRGWSGPAALGLFPHALCDVARLPVREVVSATHYVTDLTLGLGEVVFDYLKDA